MYTIWLTENQRRILHVALIHILPFVYCNISKGFGFCILVPNGGTPVNFENLINGTLRQTNLTMDNYGSIALRLSYLQTTRCYCR
jgi:hypothetical protein